MGNSNVKLAGWWSRRHEGSEAQTKARDDYSARAATRPKQRWNADAKRWEKVLPS